MHKLVICVNTENQAEHCHQNNHLAQVSEQLVPITCGGHLYKTIKQLIVFLKDKNEGDDVVPKKVLLVLPGLIILLVSIW